MCWVGRPFVGMGIGCGVWVSGGVVCGGVWLRLGWVFGVLGGVCGVGLVGGCIFLFGVWGVGFTGALGVGCYLCVMSAWGLGGEVVGAYLGAACFGGGVVGAGGVCAGGVVGALVDAVDSFAGEGLGGCGRRVLGEVGHSGVVWGFGG